MDSQEIVKLNDKEYSNFLPLNKLVVLLILGGSFYQFYWIYCNLKIIKQYENNDINVPLRFLSLFVPILNLITLYMVFSDLSRLYKSKLKLNKSYNSIIVFLSLLLFSSLVHLPKPYGIIGLLTSSLPFIFVQIKLNKVWENVETSKTINIYFTPIEMFFVVMGIFVWILLFKYYFQL